MCNILNNIYTYICLHTQICIYDYTNKRKKWKTWKKPWDWRAKQTHTVRSEWIFKKQKQKNFIFLEGTLKFNSWSHWGQSCGSRPTSCAAKIGLWETLSTTCKSARALPLCLILQAAAFPADRQQGFDVWLVLFFFPPGPFQFLCSPWKSYPQHTRPLKLIIVLSLRCVFLYLLVWHYLSHSLFEYYVPTLINSFSNIQGLFLGFEMFLFYILSFFFFKWAQPCFLMSLRQ